MKVRGDEKMEELEFGTLLQVAEYAKKLFKHHEKTEQRNAFYSFTSEAREGHDSVYEALSDGMHDMVKHLDEDSVYEYTVRAIDHVIEGRIKSTDDCDVFEWADSDTDVYTSNLTEWLNRSDWNVGYLTDALKEYGETDGFKALQIAQIKAREEVYQMVLNVLSGLIDADGGIDGTDQD